MIRPVAEDQAEAIGQILLREESPKDRGRGKCALPPQEESSAEFWEHRTGRWGWGGQPLPDRPAFCPLQTDHRGCYADLIWI